RGARVRSAATGAARARDGTRRRARARARGGASAHVSRGGAPGGARDQESADGHADRGGPAGADGRTVRQSDGDGGRGARGRNAAAEPAREGVRRVRPPARGTEERGGSGGSLDGPRQERRAIGGGRLGAGQRRAVQAAGALRSVAAGVRGPAGHRLRGDGRAGGQRGRVGSAGGGGGGGGVARGRRVGW